MRLPELADWLTFGAWDGFALAVLAFLVSAVFQQAAKLDEMRKLDGWERAVAISGRFRVGFILLGIVIAIWPMWIIWNGQAGRPGVWTAAIIAVAIYAYVSALRAFAREISIWRSQQAAKDKSGNKKRRA